MERIKKILHWIKDEVLSILPAVIYFVITFNLIYFFIGLRLQHQEVRYFTPLTITLSALILAKVLLIVHHFPFLNAFPRKPLIYNIVWKFSFYLFFIFIFWVLETSFDLERKHQHLRGVVAHVKANLVSPVFWSSFFFLAWVFFIFVVASEFVRVLGKEKINQLLFGK